MIPGKSAESDLLSQLQSIFLNAADTRDSLFYIYVRLTVLLFNIS